MPSDKSKKRDLKSKKAYLLNIYRQGSDPQESLVGTVENISGNQKGRFKTARELIAWLENQLKGNDS